MVDVSLGITNFPVGASFGSNVAASSIIDEAHTIVVGPVLLGNGTRRHAILTRNN
jgi:hypothetical protein